MKSSVTGLDLPITFPTLEHTSINETMKRFSTSGQVDTWREYAGGWNAIQHRFLAFTEDYNSFVAIVGTSGDSPQPPKRYAQEKCLYGFFSNGLSTIESFSYSFLSGSIAVFSAFL